MNHVSKWGHGWVSPKGGGLADLAHFGEQLHPQTTVHTHTTVKKTKASSSHFLGFPTVLNVNYSHGVRLRKVKEKETERQKLYVRLISALSFSLWPGGEASGVCGTSSCQQHTHRAQTPLWSFRRDWGVHSQFETWWVRPRAFSILVLCFSSVVRAWR